MKYTAIVDEKGELIAASQIPTAKPTTGEATNEPRAGPGQKVTIIDIPAESMKTHAEETFLLLKRHKKQ